MPMGHYLMIDSIDSSGIRNLLWNLEKSNKNKNKSGDERMKVKSEDDVEV